MIDLSGGTVKRVSNSLLTVKLAVTPEGAGISPSPSAQRAATAPFTAARACAARAFVAVTSARRRERTSDLVGVYADPRASERQDLPSSERCHCTAVAGSCDHWPTLATNFGHEPTPDTRHAHNGRRDAHRGRCRRRAERDEDGICIDGAVRERRRIRDGRCRGCDRRREVRGRQRRAQRLGESGDARDERRRCGRPAEGRRIGTAEPRARCAAQCGHRHPVAEVRPRGEVEERDHHECCRQTDRQE